MNHTTVTTPAGLLSIVVDNMGTVTAAGFGEPSMLAQAPRIGGGGRISGGARIGSWRPELGEVTKAVFAYLDGDLNAFDGLAVTPLRAGEFVAAAWHALRTIPPGITWNYRELAAAAGRAEAARAAANACAGNPIALLVPCHRVIRTDGGLGGYRWGLPVKRWLLSHERRVTGQPLG